MPETVIYEVSPPPQVQHRFITGLDVSLDDCLCASFGVGLLRFVGRPGGHS